MLNEDLRQHKEEEENPFEGLLEKAGAFYRQQQEQLLIDDIIDCYENNDFFKYCSYEFYEKVRTDRVAKDFNGFTVNIKPLVMSREMFEYIRIKGKRAKKC